MIKIRLIAFIVTVIFTVYTFPYIGRFWGGIFAATNSEAAKWYASGVALIIFGDIICIGYILITLNDVYESLRRKLSDNFLV
jgi:hypothetical protein